MTTLLPCPFCGGEAAIDNISTSMRAGESKLWCAGCDNNACRCESNAISPCRAEAIEAWNTRTPSGSSPLPESDSADHLGVVIGRKDTTR